ncbi:MAG: nuclear transport factor 2 family protein [Gammaproteobacteria bacterium]|nr:nuclear transport factor 2 family protein [Gammaproteobacteria bacterium]
MTKTLSQLIGLIFFSISLIACSTTRQSNNDQQDVLTALTIFVQAFENGDLELMEASFAEDATGFPRAIMSNELSFPIQISDYLRVQGIDPQMRQLVAMWHASDEEPPYMLLDPLDLVIQLYGDAALATFHLIDGDALSRRSFVLAKRAGDWKIVHLHASNVISSE